MYLSQQYVNTIHGDIVNDGLRRAEQRELCKLQQHAATGPSTGKPRPTFRAMVGGLLRMAARP
jgi:hypothetical protein